MERKDVRPLPQSDESRHACRDIDKILASALELLEIYLDAARSGNPMSALAKEVDDSVSAQLDTYVALSCDDHYVNAKMAECRRQIQSRMDSIILVEAANNHETSIRQSHHDVAQPTVHRVVRPSERSLPPVVEENNGDLTIETSALLLSNELKQVQAALKQAGVTDSEFEECFTKIFTFLRILHDLHLPGVVRKVRSSNKFIMDPFAFYFLAADSIDLFNQGFEEAIREGKANITDMLLHLCAYKCNKNTFAILCGFLGLTIGSPDYVKYMTTHTVMPLFPFSPMQMAAFSNNVGLLREMHMFMGRKAHHEYDSPDTIPGRLSLLHFATLGGALDVIEFCHKELKMPLDYAPLEKLPPFPLIALSNQPSTLRKFSELGYVPSKLDLEVYDRVCKQREEHDPQSPFVFGSSYVDMKAALKEVFLLSDLPNDDQPILATPLPIDVPMPVADAPSQTIVFSPKTDDACTRIQKIVHETLSMVDEIRQSLPMDAIGENEELEAQLSGSMQVANELVGAARNELAEFRSLVAKDSAVASTYEAAHRGLGDSIKLLLLHIEKLTKEAAERRKKEREAPPRTPAPQPSSAAPALRLQEATPVIPDEYRLPLYYGCDESEVDVDLPVGTGVSTSTRLPVRGRPPSPVMWSRRNLASHSGEGVDRRPSPSSWEYEEKEEKKHDEDRPSP
jgi:hypothetical protein